MRTFKLFLITTIAIASMTTVCGQLPGKIEKGIRFRDKVNSGSFISPEAPGNDYLFTKTTGTYADLAGAVSINNNQLWDDPEYTIPIGFDFDLFDMTIDSVYFGVGVGGLVSTPVDTAYEAAYLIFPFETDLIDRGDITGISQSPISYKLEGTPGSRIFKIEWKNAGFYDEANVLGTLNDYVNFQLWLFEGTNDIEMHYGPNMVTNPVINYFGETGAIIGVSDYDLYNGYFLSGNPESPTLVDTLVFINGTPSDGTIYKFAKNNGSSGVEFGNSQGPDTRIYPNPASGIFMVERLSAKSAAYQVTDMAGAIIQEGSLTNRTTMFDLSEYASGLYFFRVDGETTKVIKH